MSKSTEPNIGVIGGGSWATALIKVLTDKDLSVRWWMRNKQSIEHIQKYHRNPRYLSYVDLNVEDSRITSDINEVILKSDILILAIPAAFLSEVLQEFTAEDLKDKLIISAIKGMIPNKNQIIADYLLDNFDISNDQVVVLAGPCHAEEVAQQKLSYLTMAGPSDNATKRVAELFECRYMKTKTSKDLHGAEYSAILKNVVAIASGICHGLGYGDNFQAVLISNAIQEIDRFVNSVKSADRNLMDSAYLGDLLVTAYSQFSRNRTFGNMLGKGYSVKSAQMEMDMIAEGYYAVACIHAIRSEYDVEMPITDAVYNILYEKIAPVMEIRLLAEKLS